jgi:hypothetical protein
MPTSTFIVRSSMVYSVPKGKGAISGSSAALCGHRRRATRGAYPCAAALRAARAHPAGGRGRDAAMGARGGFSLDTVVRIEATDRRGLERLLRYCARPIFASERRLWAQPAARRGQGRALPCRAEDAASVLSAPQAPTRGADGAVSHAHGVLRAAGDPHPATTPAPSPLSWRPGPECPAACGGDLPRRPPDGGIRAGVEPACPNTRPSSNREITLPVNLFVGDVTRPHLRSLPAAVPPLWGADVTDRLRHR